MKSFLPDPEKRKEFVDTQRFLSSLESEAYKSFDKTLLALSSGAIALSVTALNKFDIFLHPRLVICAWLFWMLSIAGQLFSPLVSAHALREEQKISNEAHADSKPMRENKYAGIVTGLNYFSVLMFLLGTILFLCALQKIYL